MQWLADLRQLPVPTLPRAFSVVTELHSPPCPAQSNRGEPRESPCTFTVLCFGSCCLSLQTVTPSSLGSCPYQPGRLPPSGFLPRSPPYCIKCLVDALTSCSKLSGLQEHRLIVYCSGSQKSEVQFTCSGLRYWQNCFLPEPLRRESVPLPFSISSGCLGFICLQDTLFWS